MNDTRTATVRTSWFATFIAVVAFVAAKLGLEIDTDDPLLLVVTPIAVPILYRAALALSEAVPWIGYVFFGVNRSPAYTEPPPAFPAVADEGRISLDVLVIDVGIIVFLAAVVYALTWIT